MTQLLSHIPELVESVWTRLPIALSLVALYIFWSMESFRHPLSVFALLDVAGTFLVCWLLTRNVCSYNAAILVVILTFVSNVVFFIIGAIMMLHDQWKNPSNIYAIAIFSFLGCIFCLGYWLQTYAEYRRRRDENIAISRRWSIDPQRVEKIAQLWPYGFPEHELTWFHNSFIQAGKSRETWPKYLQKFVDELSNKKNVYSAV